MSVAASLWAGAATLLAPALRLHLLRRAQQGKEDSARLGERCGESAARPPGRLFWLHAASVGETLSTLPLLEAMAARDPALRFLVTTGTRTAAALLSQRLPAGLAERVAHRYAPLDVPGWVARFLRGWRPDAAAFVESEFWPNLILGAAAQGVPLALVNARLSARSASRWRRLAPGLALRILAEFRVVMAQSAADAGRLRALGASTVTAPGNLKDAAAALPADAAALAELRTAIGDRPVWLAASTHPGEEEQIFAAQATLRATRPGLLLVVVPRHPERGATISGDALPRRSVGALPDAATDSYVADTLGELGLFYRVAQVALVGGSLVPHGGQNPLEPARLGCPIVLGPHTANFAEPVARLLAAGGAIQLARADAAALAAAIGGVLDDPARAAALAAAAKSVANPRDALPGLIAEALLGLLPDARQPPMSA